MESVEFEALLNDVETRLDRLKALYEQWFQGMERLEPQIARKEVERRMVLLRKEQPRNTALRFRFQTLVQRYTTLQTYWGRVARQIEEGTYRRDLLKARKAILAAKSGRRSSPEDAFDIEVDADASEEGSVTTRPPPSPPSTQPTQATGGAASPRPQPRPALSPITSPIPAAPGPASPRIVSPFARAAPHPAGAPTAPTTPQVLAAQGPRPSATIATFARPDAAPRPEAPSPGPPATATFARPGPTSRAPESLSEQELRTVYERYAEARRKNHEPDVSYEKVAQNLREVAPKMREKFGKPVDFEVVLKNGKVGLKPVPKS